MLSAFTFSLAVGFIAIIDSVYTENQNETTQIKNDNDFAGSSDSFSRNITANFSVSDTDLDDKTVNFARSNLESNVSITDRSENEESLLPVNKKSENLIEFNTPKNFTIEPKKLENFRPSPQLETFYEYNKFPVKPVFPEVKMVRNYATVNSEGEALSIKNDRQTSRNLNNFAPGYSAFGTSDFQNSGRVENSGLSRNAGGTNQNNNAPPWITHQNANEVNRKNENEDPPWTSRVRFPQKSITNGDPYPFVPNTGIDQNVYINNGLSPPKNTDYSPPSGNNNRHFAPTNDQGTAKTNFNNININKAGYLPPITNYDYAGGGDSHTSYSPPPPPSHEQFNFNKLIDVPQTYYSEPPNSYQHDSYERPYNLMEKPSSQDHHKTHGGGGLSSNPWKKILKLFAAFIPIGLLISALTPTVITVTNVNDTSGDMPATRYRSVDDPKKELTSHILSSLDYFDKLNENGCEYRVFCELLVSASHMQNSKQHVENLLDNFAQQEIDYKNKAEELTTVFAAVRSHDCSSIPCEYIKNPT